MTAAADSALLALAGRLSAAAGRGRPVTLEPMAGGRNNRVFKVAIEGAPPLALKVYHSDPRDPRDRLAREWEFLDYVWSRGVRRTPQPLAREETVHAGLYSFIPGRRLTTDEVGAAQVQAALDFLLEINRAPRRIDALAPGSEACFSLAEHLTTIERRVAQLSALDERAPYGREAADLAGGRLNPAWRAVKRNVERRAEQAGLTLDARIEPAAECLSPSDLGFHNALAREDGALSFLDFEYAGRDDPAKLASDFFCCPEIPPPIDLHEAFVASLIGGLGLGAIHAERCHMLLDAYRLKWACIVLNDFLPVGAARRSFAVPLRSAAHNQTQLARAHAMLDQIETPV